MNAAVEVGTTATIYINGAKSQDVIDRIGQKLNVLMATMEGTMPGNRAFGLPMEFLSAPVRDARGRFAIELQEKADRYIPGILVRSVSGDIRGDGEEIMTIRVEIK